MRELDQEDQQFVLKEDDEVTDAPVREREGTQDEEVEVEK